jgi:ABC-type sugar transport system substrate-binding protein
MNRVFVGLIFFLAFSTQAIEVTFINPSYKGSPFWQQVSDVANAAASDLNISLKIIYSGGHRLLQKEQIDKLITQENKPDYVIFLPYDGTALETFKKLEQAKLPFVTLEHSLFPALQVKLGTPGKTFKYWLAEIYHDNKKAGALLAKALIKASNTTFPNKNNINVAGISGDISGHSNERNAGLITALAQSTGFSLTQIVNARWEREQAGQVFIGLIRRYQDIQLVWSASDTMALGVVDIAASQGKTLNHDLLVGGFDWTPQALQAIKNNRYTASVGGHFMQTAWALVKIYDHHQGKLVSTNAMSEATYQLNLIDRNNIDDYQVLFNSPNWHKVDFRKFSLIHQPQRAHYQFNFSIILAELNH